MAAPSELVHRLRLKQRLRAAARAGEWLDLSAESNRDVPAELLYALLVDDDSSSRLRAVKVYGSRIIGSLDLEAAMLRCPLELAKCEVKDGVVLREATAPAIRLLNCYAAWVRAEQLETHGNLELTASRITGGLSLFGAHIGGNLSLNGAELDNKSGAALRGEGLKVDGHMFCGPVGEHRFTAHGELRLIGAHIGGQFILSGAELDNKSGAALRGDGLQVEQGVTVSRRASSASRPTASCASPARTSAGRSTSGALSWTTRAAPRSTATASSSTGACSVGRWASSASRPTASCA
jgi:hypothetical protein